jgi:hypothetical protein
MFAYVSRSSRFPSELFKAIRSEHFTICYFFLRSTIIGSPSNPSLRAARYRMPVTVMKRIFRHPSPYLEGRLPIATCGSRQPFNMMVLYTLLTNQKHSTSRSVLRTAKTSSLHVIATAADRFAARGISRVGLVPRPPVTGWQRYWQFLVAHDMWRVFNGARQGSLLEPRQGTACWIALQIGVSEILTHRPV